MNEIIDIIRNFILMAWSMTEIKIIVSHTVINLVVALAAALKASDFKFHKVAEFLTKKLLPYVAVYFVIRLAGDAVGLGALGLVAWAAIEAALTGDLLDNWAKLGLPLPDVLKSLAVK